MARQGAGARWGGSAPLSRIARHYRRNEQAIGGRGCRWVGLPSKRYSRIHLGSTRFCSPAVILALTILSPTWAQITEWEAGKQRGGCPSLLHPCLAGCHPRLLRLPLFQGLRQR